VFLLPYLLRNVGVHFLGFPVSNSLFVLKELLLQHQPVPCFLVSLLVLFSFPCHKKVSSQSIVSGFPNFLLKGLRFQLVSLRVIFRQGQSCTTLLFHNFLVYGYLLSFRALSSNLFSCFRGTVVQPSFVLPRSVYLISIPKG
jgi:hypothetical protein